MIVEGQSALRNPSGPCGAEFLLSGGAKGVILQHAPAREYYDDLEHLSLRIPPLGEEMQLIKLLGARVLAITLNTQGIEHHALAELKTKMSTELHVRLLRHLKMALTR